MKKNIFILMLLLPMAVWGQRYGDNWFFGNGAGIDFNHCSPRVVTNGNNPGFEGAATISDSTGQLLFYTNSDKVWNRQHLLMPNGNINSSGGSLSQVLIIPKPGSTTLYYIVTTMLQAAGLSFQYHEIDMTLDGTLGNVISSGNIITSTVITEQVAATYHNNGTDLWLMTHEYGTNRFLAFLVTSAGISLTPVVSAIGPSHAPCISNMNARGEIKFSPDGNKVAFNGNGIGINDSTNLLAVFDFNTTTGIVSNPIELPYYRGDFGLSFSPDNSKLYGATWKAFSFTEGDYNYLYQYDLSNPTPSAIIASGQVIDSTDGPYGILKLAPDGKLYVARSSSMFLGVINSPNIAGTACNYVSNGLNLGGETCLYGLNNYIEYKNYCNTGNTGLDAWENEMEEINVYPNPSNGKLTITFPLMETQTTFTLFDLQGRLLMTRNEINGERIDIENTDLKAGTYIFYVRSAEKIYTGKLLVE